MGISSLSTHCFTQRVALCLISTHLMFCSILLYLSAQMSPLWSHNSHCSCWLTQSLGKRWMFVCCHSVLDLSMVLKWILAFFAWLHSCLWVSCLFGYDPSFMAFLFFFLSHCVFYSLVNWFLYDFLNIFSHFFYLSFFFWWLYFCFYFCFFFCSFKIIYILF